MRARPAGPQRLFGTVALVAIGGGLVASLAQTARRRDLNLLEHGVSFYALGPQGTIQTIAIVAVGLGSIVLAAGLRFAVGGSGGRLGSLCVALWGTSIIVAGLVPIDLNRPISRAGIVHDAAGTVANLFLIAGIVQLSRAMGGDPLWRGFARFSRYLAIAALLVVVVANLGRPTIPWGIGQRVYLALLLGWLIATALAVRRLAVLRPGLAFRSTPGRERLPG